jgi:transcriptional regulator with XRE-family HTH domain
MGDEKPNHPARLRALRYILGRDNKLLPGEQFADLCGMKPSTLRAIESGLRALNSMDEGRIAEQLGAIWRDEESGWYCVSDPERPYTVEYRNFYMSGSDKLQADPSAIVSSLEVLERSLTPGKYQGALLAVHRLIRSIAETYAVPMKEIESIQLMQPIKMKDLTPASRKRTRATAVSDMQKRPARKSAAKTAA